nr:MAG TPA: hypothetical protein [Caudoviricetes sp.]
MHSEYNTLEQTATLTKLGIRMLSRSTKMNVLLIMKLIFHSVFVEVENK